MTSPLYIPDASGLRAIATVTPAANLTTMLAELTKAVEEGRLGFPKEVVDELGVIARDEPIHAWGLGLGSHLKPYSANIKYSRPLLGHAASLGFVDGMEGLDGKDPAVVHVGRLAVQLQVEGKPFQLVTEDVGQNPLRPTLEQLCFCAGWGLTDPLACIFALGLRHLLI